MTKGNKHGKGGKRPGSIWEEVIAKHRDELDKRLAELDK